MLYTEEWASGCGGALRPVKRPVVSGTGEVSWVDGFVNGCDPSSCLGGCDKDMSGLSIEGHVFRFAACQFGQKTAGSPLNSLVMSVARYFARLPQEIHPVRPYLTSVMPFLPLPYIHCTIREWQTSSPLAP